MTHTPEHDCAICGTHFEDSKALARHNEEAHHSAATEPVVDETYAKDRNPRQGFQDPRTDASRRT